MPTEAAYIWSWRNRFNVTGLYGHDQRAEERPWKALQDGLGLGSADLTSLGVARERALEYRRLAKQGLHPKYLGVQDVPCFEELARQVHIERLPTWKNPKHGQPWINTLNEYVFPKIGRLSVSDIGRPEVLKVLSPIWTESMKRRDGADCISR